MVWKEETRFSERTLDEAPNTRRADADVKSGKPAIGRYSWFKCGSERNFSSAYKNNKSTIIGKRIKG